MVKDDLYFREFDKDINYDSATYQFRKVVMSKLDIATMFAIPLLLTVVSVFVLKSTLATLLSGFVWFYFIYVFIVAYSNQLGKA